MDRTGTAVRSVEASDRRPIREIGRHARLELHFALRGGRTVIEHAYAEPPFRVGRAFDVDGALHLIMTTSSPGIFGGDDFDQSIIVGPGARVSLTSQSALQLHGSVDGRFATMRCSYDVSAGASLTCRWDPLIPFPGAKLQNRLRVDVASDASLLWSDAVMSGRQARGERWRFDCLDHELALRRGGDLVYLERYRLEPECGALDSAWVSAGANYFGTILHVGETVAAGETETLHGALQSVSGVVGASDLLTEGVALTRLAAATGIVFHHARALGEQRNGGER